MPSPSSPSACYVTDVAYLPGYYPFMAPARMRYVASLQGIRPPAVREGFDFLELGCGFGSTLLTLAAANPQGRFTGRRLHAGAHRADRAGGRRHGPAERPGALR